MHGDLESLALLSYKAVPGQLAFLEDYVGGGGASDTKLGLLSPETEAGRGEWNVETANSAVLQFLLNNSD